MTIVCKINASHRDGIYKLKRFFNGIGALWGQANLGRVSWFHANQALSCVDKQYLRNTKIASLTVFENADYALLSDPTLFKHLLKVRLESDDGNAHHLRQLSNYYPSIKFLTVRNKKPLLLHEAASLAAFKKLAYLDLECGFQQNFGIKLPRSVVFLQLRYPLGELDLPLLSELHLKGCTIHKDFFLTLKAPKLERISLWKVQLDDGTFGGLANFSSLREINMRNVTGAAKELQTIRHLTRLSVCLAEDSLPKT